MRGNNVTAQSYAKGECTFDSALEIYISRCQLQAPKSKTMMSKHPVSHLPLAEHIRIVMQHEPGPDTMVVAFDLWPEFIQLLSWWEYTKCFTRERNVIELRRSVDVIVSLLCLVLPKSLLRQSIPFRAGMLYLHFVILVRQAQLSKQWRNLRRCATRQSLISWRFS